MRLKVTNYLDRRHIKNTIGYIKGAIEPEKYVILGNHHDAWVYGARDPNGATAVLVETARVFKAVMNATGWRPRRTLVFCSWDAEEYGLIGSDEWIEVRMECRAGDKFTHLAAAAAAAAWVRFSSCVLGTTRLRNYFDGSELDRTIWISAQSFAFWIVVKTSWLVSLTLMFFFAEPVATIALKFARFYLWFPFFADGMHEILICTIEPIANINAPIAIAQFHNDRRMINVCKIVRSRISTSILRSMGIWR